MRVRQAYKFNERLAFIVKWIHVYCAMTRPRDEWISKRVCEFLAITVYLYENGYPLKGRDASKLYKKIGNFKNSQGEVTTYRNKLVDEGWLVETRTGYRPIDPLIGISDEIILQYQQNYEPKTEDN